MTKKEELKIEQGGLVAQLRDNLTKSQRISIRERLHEISKELTALHEDQNRSYLHVRGYDKKARQFDLLKSPQPIKADRYFVALQRYVWRLGYNGELERVHCSKDTTYKLQSGSSQYFLQSKDKRLLQQYISYLGLDGVEVVQRLSKEAQAEQDREDWKFDADTVRPLKIPRSGTFLLEGNKIK